MTTKPEAEKAIRHLVGQWAKLKGIRSGQVEMPDFYEFVRWARAEAYGSYFNFRSVAGPMEDAERWFDEELGQSWRN